VTCAPTCLRVWDLGFVVWDSGLEGEGGQGAGGRGEETRNVMCYHIYTRTCDSTERERKRKRKRKSTYTLI
jgi:hypothetical protein